MCLMSPDPRQQNRNSYSSGPLRRVFCFPSLTAPLASSEIKSVESDMGRIAIVTGGTRGIGRAICERLKRDGFTVIANYAGNDAAANQLKANTGIANYKWDVGDHQSAV